MIWSIEVYQGSSSVPVSHISVCGGDVLETAEALSKVHPEHTVTVSAHARIRCTLIDGQIVKERPDFSEFYLEVTPQQVHEWKEYLATLQ